MKMYSDLHIQTDLYIKRRMLITIIICVIFILSMTNDVFASTNISTNTSHQAICKYLYTQVINMRPQAQLDLLNQEIYTAYDINLVAIDNGLTINGDYAEAMIDNYASSCIGTPKESVMEYQINYRLTPAQNKAYQNKTAKIAKRIKAKKLSKEKTVRQW